MRAQFAEIVIACLLIASPTLAADMPASGTTAMFRGGLGHTGFYADAGPERSPRIRWRFRTAGKIMSSPAIGGDTIYFGSTDGKLYAADVNTGAQRWAFQTDGRVTSSPAVYNGAVYFTSYDGYFYAVEQSTGKLRWKFKTGGERRYAATHLHGHSPPDEVMPDPFDVYLSSPSIAGGLVYFGSGDGNVYALDAATGALRWSFRTGDVVHSSPAVKDGIVYIGSWDSFLYALDAKTGAPRWQFQTGADPQYHNQVGIQSSPVVSGNVVYFGCRDNKVYALDALRGTKIWARDNDGSWVNSSPAVDGKDMWYATGDTNRVEEVDARTGASLKSFAVGPWYFFSSPALTRSMMYIGSWDGRLYAIKRGAGTIEWTFQTDASRQNIAHFLKSDGKRKFYLDGANGFYDDLVSAIDGQFRMGSFLSSPVVRAGVIYIGSTDGSLYALGA
jgi:outer membrane protein assembly factor BamB